MFLSSSLLVLIGSQCSHRLSVVFSGSRKFSVVPRRFSMFLSGSCWFS